MQTLIDKDGSFRLPTGWHEISTAQFCATDPLLTVEARASYFAGRPIQVNAVVADALAWMLTPPPTDTRFNLPLLDLGQETYLQVESIRGLLATLPLHECFAQVYGIATARQTYWLGGDYHPAHADKMATRCACFPIGITYPAVTHCLAELQRLATVYAELAEPDPTEAARRAREAGADELLGIFGHLSVAHGISMKLGISLDAAYQLPYSTVAFYLLHDRRVAVLQDNLSRNNSKQSPDQ